MLLSFLLKRIIDSSDPHGGHPTLTPNTIQTLPTSLPSNTKIQFGSHLAIAQHLIRLAKTKQEREKEVVSLCRFADDSLSLQRNETVASIGNLLLALADSQHEVLIAQYYRAVGLNRPGVLDMKTAPPLLEAVAHLGPPAYRARSLLALGNRRYKTGDYYAALSIYGESIQLLRKERVFDLSIFAMVTKMSAVARGDSGDHRGAVATLNQLKPILPTLSIIEPQVYFDCLNALAVELMEIGELEEARWLAHRVLTAPPDLIQQEWRETYDEIAIRRCGASRSKIVVPVRYLPGKSLNESRPSIKRNVEAGKRSNILALKPLGRRDAENGQAAVSAGAASVIDFQQRRNELRRPPRLLKPLDTKERGAMTIGEKVIRLMDLISRDETDEEMIDDILDAVEAIVLHRAGLPRE